MSASLAEVAKYCNGLSSDRQTERKTSISKLIERLKEIDVQNALDGISASKGKKRLSWDILAQSMFAYVLCEADTLKGSSKLTEETILRKTKDISEAFRSFIQAAEKRGPVLKAGDVFHHIWLIMCDSKTSSWFCNEYTNVLLKSFLSVEEHVCEISTKIWHDLGNVYCKCLLQPPLRGDASLFAQTLNQLISVGGNIINIRGKGFFIFFGDIFKDIRNDRNETVVYYLLSALNSFSLRVAADNRGQLCILGEDLLPLLLPLWNKCSVQVKDQLINFFRIQVDLHHPFGVHQEENGAWSSNEKFWKKWLTKLHDAVNSEFQQLAGKLQLSGSKAELAQKSNFIELAVGTYHQINYHANLDQKEVDDTSILGDEIGSSRKRRKTESRWQTIIDGISLTTCPSACIAWLQFLACYIERYSLSFPCSEYLSFITYLHQAMVNCKRPDVLGFILRALRSLADKTNSIMNQASQFTNKQEVLTQWRNIWFETLKAIHSRNVVEAGYMLLTSILKAELFIPCEDAFKAFFSSGTRVCREALKFVICLLERFPMPEKLSNDMEIYGGLSTARYQVREKMISLVLPDVDYIVGQKHFSDLLSNSSSDANSVAAVVTLSMLQKNPSSFSKGSKHIDNNSTRIDQSDDYTKMIRKIGDIYLKSTFNCVSRASRSLTKKRDSLKHANGIVVEMCVFIQRRITELKESVIVLQRDEEFCKTSNNICNWLKICFRYVSQFLNVLVLLSTESDTGLKDLEYTLIDSIKTLLHQTTSKIKAMYREFKIEDEARDALISSIFSCLNYIFGMEIVSGLSHERLISVFPSSFLALVFDIMSGRLQPISRQASRSQLGGFCSSSSSSTTLGDFDDLMEKSDRSVYTHKSLSNQMSTRQNFQETVDETSISKAESVCVAAGKFLFQFAFCKDDSAVVQMKDRSLKDLLLDFLDENFNSRKPRFFHMLKNLVFHLTNDVIRLPPADLEVLFECVRKFVSELRSNQIACSEGLKILHDLTIFLVPCGQQNEDQLNQMRLITNKIVSAFWTLRNEKYSPEVRLMLLECIVKLMQIDPEGIWTKVEISKRGKNAASTSEEFCSLENCLLKFLSDKTHFVRMRAAQHVTNLFQTDCGKPRSPAQQLEAFNKVADALTELIIIKDDLSEDEIEDVSANRAATLLYVLKNVACSSLVCEKKAIALLFHDYKGKFLDLKLVGKVFRDIALEKGFKDAKIYLKENLSYLCNDWVKRGFPITDFPSNVVLLETAEFLRTYAREIVPYLMFYRDQSTFDKIKEILNLQDPWGELLLENFDRIIVFSLPLYGCQSKRMEKGLEDEAKIQEFEAERKKAKLAYEFLEKSLTKEVIEKLLVKRFDDIVIELLLRMFDPPSEESDASQFMRDTDAAPNPPYFTSYAVRGTLEYLATCHRNKTIVEVLSMKKDSTQKILLALAIEITNAKSERDKVRLLCAYRLFVLLLLDDVQNGLGSNWAFFMRDVIYRCCHWLNWHFHVGEDDTFFLCVYQVLQKISEAGLMACSQEFGCHVIKIVNTLTKFAKREDEKARRALHLLRFIVVENSETIRDALVDLPPFPDTLAFQALSKRLDNLKKENLTRNCFDDFKILHQQNLVSLEAVKSLLRILKEDKNLVERFIEVNNDGSTVVLSVVSNMLDLATSLEKSESNGSIEEMKLAIGRCLGEIGPINFHSLALPPHEEISLAEDEEYFGSNKSAFRYHVVLDRLSSLLTNESTNVVSAAAIALKDALQTSSGIKHMNVFDVGKGEKPKFFSYCEPFKPPKNKKGSQGQHSQQFAPPSVQDFIASVGAADLWDPGVMSFDVWIKELSSTLISSGAVEDEIFSKVASVCKLDASFAELMLPFLVHNILLNCNEGLKSLMSSFFNRFFSLYPSKRNNKSQRSTVVEAEDLRHKSSKIGEKEKAARTLINVVNYLREQDKPMKSNKQVITKWDNNFWLDVKYLDLAQMAFECSSHFAAVMFTEIWCDIQKANFKDVLNTDSVNSSQGTQLEELPDMSDDASDKASCQRLLFEAYRSIGEPDAIYGVGTGYSSDMHTRVKAYEFEQDFGKAILTQDLQADDDKSCNSLALAQVQIKKHFCPTMLGHDDLARACVVVATPSENLERAGLHHVLFTYMKGLDRNFIQDVAAYESLQLEACWRNGIWDMESHSRSLYQDKTTFSGNIYNAIIALKDGGQGAFESTINEARLNLLKSEEIGANLSTSCLHGFLAKMKAVTELETYGQQYFSNDLVPGSRKVSLPNDFKYFELSLSLKAAAMKVTIEREISKNERQSSTLDEIVREAYSHFMRSAVLAREAGRYQVCERHLHDVSHLETIVQIPSDWRIEQAKMFWDRGEKNRAMYDLRALIKICEKGKDQSIAELYPIALGLYGHWLAETRSENPGIIIDNYMEHAACLLEDSQCTLSENPSEAYYLLAKYADSQYESIKDYIKSSAFESKQTVIKKVKDEINRLDAMGDTARAASNNRYYRSLVAQCSEDEKELQQMVKDRKQFLQKALENYVRCLCRGDKYDLRIFRLCSLWLENSHEVMVNQIIKNCIKTMESRKFLPLMYQLAARLGSATSKDSQLFNDNLEKLLEKAAKDHPHHVTIIIMALCNVEVETPEVTPTTKRGKLSKKTAGEKNINAEKSRVHSAKAVLGKLKTANPKLVESMEIVMNAYMELAYYDIQHLKRQTGKFELPSKLLLRRVKDMKFFAMPTIDIPVDPSCQYKDITYISGFDNTFTHCGGINLPKVVTCIGSDGKRRRQLVKGKDDLRQDAVMQQVFGMVNQLLEENKETRKRQLRIRTYKVVPLSQRSGIVEWCENTFPLGEYLIGNRGIGGAHSRYHPTDWTAADCRKKFNDAANSNGKKSRYDTLQNIMSNFRPVFRHFFYEKFTDPVEWFTRRLAYTRSLASTSIVGYVVGLGDRHVQNILIDFITAELVHIDLGIAFEQGKQLPTPETIPFRLTRDLVDGMGIAGVEGVFRRCCEKVMNLMRSSQEAIQTIVEVLLYDPLYVWTLSPLKAVQVQQKLTDDAADTLQNMSTVGDANLDNLLGELQSLQPQQDHSKNKMAQRVLIRLKQKLDGNEGGCFLSTEGQVNFLIQSARDSKNLCRLFPGWQPWL